ncbi:retrovirus-related pol polyprotein from transposon TNT 1-94 [Tanacetum coccineum]
MSGSQDEIPPPPPPPPSSSQIPTQTPHTVSTIKLPILKKGEYDIWAIIMEHYLAHTDYPIWEVIQNRNGHVSITTDTQGQIKVLPPRTAEEIVARERERKARTTLLMALPEDHFAKFYKMTDAKEMWEGLHKGYNRFQSLLSQLEIHGVGSKLTIASSSSTQNVAFVSENTSSTNDVSTAYSVSNPSGQNSQCEQTSSYSLLANQSSCPQLDHEDLEQLDEYDLEEMDLKWREPVGFDKTKVECYNCHKTCHFARECRTKGNQDSRRRDAWNSGNKDGRRSGKQEDSKALVTIDGEGVDWTSHSEEEEDYALMACNSSGLNRNSSQREKRAIWNNVQRVNKQNQFVPTPVLTRTGKIPVNTARTSGTKNVSTARHSFNRQVVLTSAAMKVNTVKPIVNRVRPTTIFHKTYSLFSRPFNKTTALRTNFSKQKVNTAKLFRIKIVDRDVPRHMTGNKAILPAEYQDFNGGLSLQFKNKDFIEFCGSKGIKREYSNARTPQQNGVAERKNRTLIEAARTMLADSFLPNTFWAEAVSTACYVLNRVLVTKPHNKTPYELVTGKIPIISYIRPFGCHVTILNTIDHLGKFDGKSDEGFLVGYSLQSKAFRVYNLETKRVEENSAYTLCPQEANQNAGTEDIIEVEGSEKEDESAQDYFVLPIWSSYSSMSIDKEDQVFLDELERLKRQEKDANDAAEALRKEFAQETENLLIQAGAAKASSTKHRLYTNAIGTKWVIEIRRMREEFVVRNKASFIDPKYPQKVYKVVKALYGLHQAPRACFATLSTFLLQHGYRRGTIDKTFFIKKDKHDIILVQVYVDDIIFGSTKKTWCDEFEALIKGRFQMSSMGELTFFLRLQVKQKADGIFISQDKYVAEILKKFDFVNVKTASTPIETQKPLVKDEEAMMWNVTSKTSHLRAVKRIFRYLKGKPKLGLWYPRVSSFDLEAYSDSDYVGANLDRKSLSLLFLSSPTYFLGYHGEVKVYRGSYKRTRLRLDTKNHEEFCIQNVETASSL